MASALTESDRNATYERTTVRYLLGPWAPRLIELAELRLDERVLDLATCNGTVARLAAQWVGPTGAVTGADPDGEALAFARALPPPPGAPIEWIEARAEDLPLPDSSMDVVLCQQGLQFFEDRHRALCEVRRVLRSEGRAVFSCWMAANAMDLAVREALSPRVSAEAARRMNEYVSLHDPDELRALFIEAGFQRVKILPRTMSLRYPPLHDFLPQRLRFGGTGEVFAAMTAAERDALIDSVVEAVQEYRVGSETVVPSQTHLVTAFLSGR